MVDQAIQTPTVEAPTAIAPADNTRQIISMLNNAHYLLNSGSFQGKDSELLVVTKDFLIALKKHLETQLTEEK